MARYSQAFKAKAVARLLPPESATLDEVSRGLGVRTDTLSRWRSEALSDSQDRLWTGPARNWEPVGEVWLNPDQEATPLEAA